ncbi:hypothetical protein HPP92_029056 [Vanilla planifolia]|uniref:Uncharacterized protein n=1 Tax=Vanilla planifolia TaxID=51239 RepID=A0A835P535_VANPL|nr:hypothetical protein HPP92_029056 [Vanilla planifolia]
MGEGFQALRDLQKLVGVEPRQVWQGVANCTMFLGLVQLLWSLKQLSSRYLLQEMKDLSKICLKSAFHLEGGVESEKGGPALNQAGVDRAITAGSWQAPIARVGDSAHSGLKHWASRGETSPRPDLRFACQSWSLQANPQLVRGTGSGHGDLLTATSLMTRQKQQTHDWATDDREHDEEIGRPVWRWQAQSKPRSHQMAR